MPNPIVFNQAVFEQSIPLIWQDESGWNSGDINKLASDYMHCSDRDMAVPYSVYALLDIPTPALIRVSRTYEANELHAVYAVTAYWQANSVTATYASDV